MAEMSVIWLRVAAGLYSLGLLHAILMLVRRREHLFRVALAAFALGKSGPGESGWPEPRSFASVRGIPGQRNSQTLTAG